MSQCINVSRRGQCKNKSVKNESYCNMHKHRQKAQKNKTESEVSAPPVEISAAISEREDDTISIISNVSNCDAVCDAPVGEDSTDEINLTKQFIFQCIDDYFDEHKKRQERIDSFTKGGAKKSGGSFGGLQGALLAGGVSVLPMLLKHFAPPNIDAQNKQGSTDEMEGVRKSKEPIPGRADHPIEEESTSTATSDKTPRQRFDETRKFFDTT